MNQDIFWRHVDRSDPDGCWPWMGAKTRDGYGRRIVGGREVRCHRWLLGALRGRPLDRDEIACHHCDNPSCVRPDHLYIGTQATNVRDAVVRGRWAETKKQHCPQGHPYDYVSPSGRGCRICRREAWRRYYHRRLANV